MRVSRNQLEDEVLGVTATPSSLCPGHAERMAAHAARVQAVMQREADLRRLARAVLTRERSRRGFAMREARIERRRMRRARRAAT